MTPRRLLLAATLLAARAASAEDLRLERLTTIERERPGGPTVRTTRKETLWIGEGRFRLDDKSGRESWIVRLDTKSIVRIDSAAGTYVEWTFEEAAQARTALAADVAIALKRVTGSADEPRLRKWLADFSPAAAEAVAAKDGDAGKPVSGKATKSLVLTPKEGAPTTLTVASLPASGTFAEALGAAGLIPAGIAEVLKKSGGLPLAGSWTLSFPDGVGREKFETSSIEETPAPADTWSPPKGCRKVSARSMAGNHKGIAAPAGGYDGDRPKEEIEVDEEPTGEEAGTEK